MNDLAAQQCKERKDTGVMTGDELESL